MRELMSTREVADYLRLKERKLYDLVARGVIPHSRISGKLLFPRSLVDEWVRRGMSGAPLVASRNAPAVLAGSHDPLLEWAVRESRCGLATMTYGSLDGVDRLLAGTACANVASVNIYVNTPASDARSRFRATGACELTTVRQ